MHWKLETHDSVYSTLTTGIIVAKVYRWSPDLYEADVYVDGHHIANVTGSDIFELKTMIITSVNELIHRLQSSITGD